MNLLALNCAHQQCNQITPVEQRLGADQFKSRNNTIQNTNNANTVSLVRLTTDSRKQENIYIKIMYKIKNSSKINNTTRVVKFIPTNKDQD